MQISLIVCGVCCLPSASYVGDSVDTVEMLKVYGAGRGEVGCDGDAEPTIAIQQYWVAAIFH
jgi:hypothetical protein